MTCQFDEAEELERAEREAGIARVSAALEGDGADDCTSCGQPIPEARRKAAPFATRCVPCQQRTERR